MTEEEWWQVCEKEDFSSESLLSFSWWLRDEAEDDPGAAVLQWAVKNNKRPRFWEAAYAVRDKYEPGQCYEWWIDKESVKVNIHCKVPILLLRDMSTWLKGHADPGEPEHDYREFVTPRQAWEQLVIAARKTRFSLHEESVK